VTVDDDVLVIWPADRTARQTERTQRRHLPWPDTPDVDLLWRTGGERRISNFLLWQAAYAELRFTDAYWPDVDRRDLWQAITEYSTRQRRHGAVPASNVTTDGFRVENSAAR
jgi:undecaprenyl diphosphate synthase